MTSVGFNVDGKYKLVVRKADGSIKEETDWFDNLITGAGINWLFTATTYSAWRGVAGAGNATPVLSDTTLQSYLGACTTKFADSGTYQATTAPYWVRRTITFRGALGAVVGNVSEVGVAMSGSPTASTTLFSRALVVDSNGNPTSVAVAADEQLDIVWQFTVYMSPSSGTFNQMIDGVSTPFNYAIDALGLGIDTTNGGWASMSSSYDTLYPLANGGNTNVNIEEGNTLSSVTRVVGGGQSISMETDGTYISNSYNRNYKVTCSLNQANFATGIGWIAIPMNFFKFQIAFTSTKVLKTSSKTYTFNFNVAISNGAPA
jgi:hypothetical protein